ncbi:MAG: hemolysin III family protein [Anaeroplasmataceae bacterium]|nr:hemolysin III family protein [Anaeroplasmataceae bacterium]
MEENKAFLKQQKKDMKLNKKNLKVENKKDKEIESAKKDLMKQEEKEALAPIKKERKERIHLLNEPPKRPVLEEIGNAITHGIGAGLGVVGLVLMLLKSDTPLKVTASIVYGLCMTIMMLMSCLYHSFKKGTMVKHIWRRFDYSSIYLLIGGTFAPIYLVYWGDTLGIVLFIIQWVAIITGITFVCIFGPGRIRWLHYTLYFVIGWSGLMFIPDFIQNNLSLLWFILGGGIVYTLGMIPFAKKGIKGAHFIWHFFVLCGAIVQYIGILLCIF